MKKNFLQCHTFIGSVVLSFVYLAPLSAIPLQPGMQLVADPQLQACLDQAGNANNWTTTEEVTELSCPNQGIQNLDGIEQLVNLKQLNLSGNRLNNTYGLEQLSQLTVLDLSENGLLDISSLLNLHNLHHLNLSGNSRINTWDVEAVIHNNYGLTHLGVADIPFQNPAHLWLPPSGPQGEYDLVELDISRTGQYLDLMQVMQYPNLKVLKAAGNQIHHVSSLDQLPQLEVLDLSNNNLDVLPGWWSVNQLRQLNLSGNSRLQAPEVLALIQHNPGLTQLGVADIAMGNDLSWLPHSNLIELDISRTGQYEVLPDFMQYPNLRVLKAVGNQTHQVSSLYQLSQLEVLDLGSNSLIDLYGLHALHNLRQLNLSGNSRVQAYEALMLIQHNPGLTQLGVADIAMGNDLSWLPHSNLIELDISRTGQYEVLPDFMQYPNLRVLKAAGNQTHHVSSLDQLSQLEVLDLGSNSLIDLYGLHALHNLRQLNLSGNSRVQAYEALMLIQHNPGLTQLGVADIAMGGDNLNWLPPRGPQGEYDLVELDISRTGQYLDLMQVTQYPNLKVLKAAGNQTHHVDPLDQLIRLEVLDLSNNNLDVLPGWWSVNQLRQLNLSGNSRLQAPEVLALIQHNPGLTQLSVTDIAMGNDLNWLPPRGPQGEYDLVELDISRTGQYLDLMQVTQYPNLKVLKAAGNQTHHIDPLDQLIRLEVLDLSNNNLDVLPGWWSVNQLRQLNLSGNSRLQAPEVLALIQHNPGLTQLSVADIAMGNDLNWLPPRGPQGEYDLVELDISRTGQYLDLMQVTQYPNLKVLKAAGNQTHHVDPLDQLIRLEVLDLSNNNLDVLPGWWSVNQLRQLNLSGNSRLQAPEVLALIQHNPGLTQLSVADIAMGNDLNWLPPRGPQGEYNLVELDISRTGQLVDLSPIHQYENLRALKAVGLQLQYAEPIHQLKRLEILDLRNNALKHVETLGTIHSLNLLDLRGNNLIPCHELDNLEASLIGVEFYRPASCVYFNQPTITLLTPIEAEQYFTTDLIHLSASANDAEDGDLSKAIKWTSNLDGVIGIGSPLDVSLSAGQHQLTATTTDSHGNTESKSVNVTVLLNNPPELSLSSIQDGMVFNMGNNVLLIAEATDVEDGDISHLIIWTSSIDGQLGTGGAIHSYLSVGQHTITASITDATGATIEKTVLITINALSELDLQAPISGTIYQQGDAVALAANANDLEDGDLSAQIVWTSSLDGNLGNGAQINLNLTAGTHLITASVTDSAGVSVTKSVTVTVNSAPQISLLAPVSGRVFMLKEAIDLNASATDPEDGNISANIEWSSDIDGPLGTGAVLSKSLSLGTHTLTATIRDNAGGLATVSTKAIVQQIVLNVTTRGTGKRKTAELVWSGSRTSVDIYMNNSVINVGPASGSQQLTFKDSAVFKVCETNTGYCSVEVLAQ